MSNAAPRSAVKSRSFSANKVVTALLLFVVQTRKTAGWLAGELSREGHQVALLSGEMQVEQRAAVIERFRDGKEKVLVTTNVCARGKRQNQHHVIG